MIVLREVSFALSLMLTLSYRDPLNNLLLNTSGSSWEYQALDELKQKLYIGTITVLLQEGSTRRTFLCIFFPIWLGHGGSHASDATPENSTNLLFNALTVHMLLVA